jgi:hypothetical protein
VLGSVDVPAKVEPAVSCWNSRHVEMLPHLSVINRTVCYCIDVRRRIFFWLLLIKEMFLTRNLSKEYESRIFAHHDGV